MHYFSLMNLIFRSSISFLMNRIGFTESPCFFRVKFRHYYILVWTNRAEEVEYLTFHHGSHSTNIKSIKEKETFSRHGISSAGSFNNYQLIAFRTIPSVKTVLL